MFNKLKSMHVRYIKDIESPGEGGFSLIENLVSIILLSLVLAPSTNLIVYSMQANSAARNYSVTASEVQEKIDQVRNTSFNQILAEFGSTYSDIEDGDTASQEWTSNESRANFTITYTAIKGGTVGLPEAVKIHVRAVQRRGRLGDLQYDYETIMAKSA